MGAERTPQDKQVWRPNPKVMALWPDVSGNAINGLGETEKGPPRPVFWRTDGSTPHAPAMYYFFEKGMSDPRTAPARRFRERTEAIPVHDIADEQASEPTDGWTAAVKQAALDLNLDDVGVCAWRQEWSFPDRPAPRGKWAIVVAVIQDYDAMKPAPSTGAFVEMMAQYERAGSGAKNLANWIRDRGWFAEAKTGPSTEDVLMIPPAIEAGMGELGKHGSIIHRRFGSSFRLSMVLTDMPLEPDAPDVFGADEFCASCQVCANACPPDAIYREKQMVRGTRKWYVDFDKCVPFFVDNHGCAICLAVCPWSRPGIAENLLAKLARRRA
jgi:epoxyqueuosine reductase